MKILIVNRHLKEKDFKESTKARVKYLTQEGHKVKAVESLDDLEGDYNLSDYDMAIVHPNASDSMVLYDHKKRNPEYKIIIESEDFYGEEPTNKLLRDADGVYYSPYIEDDKLVDIIKKFKDD